MSIWSFYAAAVTALTALAIAFIAYPWQKRKDRQQQVLSEKRETYRRFIQEANSFFGRAALGSKLSAPDMLQEHYLRVIAQSSDLIVYAPKEVIEACQKYTQVLFEYTESIGNERSYPGYSSSPKRTSKQIYPQVKLLRRAAMLSIRRDLDESTTGSPDEAINAFFVLTPSEKE